MILNEAHQAALELQSTEQEEKLNKEKEESQQILQNLQEEYDALLKDSDNESVTSNFIESEIQSLEKDCPTGITNIEKDILLTIRRAFHEIEEFLNGTFHRGICIYQEGKQLQKFDEYSDKVIKSSTHVEFDIGKILKKHIEQTPYDKNIIADLIYSPDTLQSEYSYRWVVDGMDGAVHYTRDIPIFATSIALEMLVSDSWITNFAAVYIHATKEVFYAFKNRGAYLNNWSNRSTSGKEKNIHSRILYSISNFQMWYQKSMAFTKMPFRLIEQACPNVNKVRGFNICSFGLSYLAKGSF